MKTFKLHLIRHGVTAGNLQGLYIGSGTDIPLCDEGRAQLAELKERFEYPQVDTVFSSPMLRAVETANILFPNAAHTFTVHDLREAGFGKFENKPVKELVHDEDFKKWITPGSGFVPEGAEPTEQFHARCAESLLKLFEYMIRMDVTEAACVTHGGVIMSMLSQRALPSRRPEQWMADPGCGYTVQTDVQLWMRDKLVEAIDIVPFGYADTLRGQAETEENEAYEQTQRIGYNPGQPLDRTVTILYCIKEPLFRFAKEEVPMSQAISRRSFLKCAGSGAVSLAAALLTGVSAAAAELRAAGDPALLDGKAAVELLGYAPAPGLGGVLVYLSVENLSAMRCRWAKATCRAVGCPPGRTCTAWAPGSRPPATAVRCAAAALPPRCTVRTRRMLRFLP